MSHKTFSLPDLGEGLPDATIVEWYVKVGDVIKLDENLVSMETRRRWSTMPSPVSGKVLKLAGAAGDVIVTGTMLAEFEIDPSLPQRAEGQDTGHHHASPLPPPEKVPKADEGGKAARRRRHRGRRDAGRQCGGERSRGRGRRGQGGARGARDGAQARRRHRPRARPAPTAP